MRKILALAASLLAAPALAGPADDSRLLYVATGEAAALFADLLGRAADEPAAVAIALKDDVSRRLNRADDIWMAAMTAEPAAYAPYLPCRGATLALQGVSDAYAVWLGGHGGRPDTGLDLSAFRQDFTSCELALGLSVTFGDEAETLSE